MKAHLQTAVISITGTFAAIAFGFFGCQYLGLVPMMGIGAGLFGLGGMSAIAYSYKPTPRQQAPIPQTETTAEQAKEPTTKKKK